MSLIDAAPGTLLPLQATHKRVTPVLVVRSRMTEAQDPGTVTVKVPLKVRRQGSRKMIIAPSGEVETPAPAKRVDSTMVKALARGFRWRKLLETGVHATVTDLARAEKINLSYVSRLLRLTLLAPEMVEAILEGRHSTELTLSALTAPWSLDWEEQRSQLNQ